MLPYGLYLSLLSVCKQLPALCVACSWGGSRCLAGSPLPPRSLAGDSTAAVPQGGGCWAWTKLTAVAPLILLSPPKLAYPGLSPHPAVVHSGKLAGLGKRCSTSWALGPLLFNPARKGYSLLFWAEGRACSSIPTC